MLLLLFSPLVYYSKANLHSEAQSENIFARDGFAKELLGEELHAKVAAYFSREAIAKREAQLESAQHGMR